MLCGAGIVFSAVLQSCKTAFYAPNTISENKIVVSKKHFAQNKFVLIKNDQLQAPVYLTKINESEYSAISMLCTHKSCELKPAGINLVCPCHGSEFSNTGKVLSPPAEKDLKKYNITSDMENIYIQL